LIHHKVMYFDTDTDIDLSCRIDPKGVIMFSQSAL
jgi:hypothetical protein